MIFNDFELFIDYIINIFKIFIIYLLTKLKLIFNTFYIYVKNKFYDYFFGNANIAISTPRLFESVLNKCPKNSNIMDFGCGNGIYYKKSFIKNQILNNNFKITGIDIDSQSIKICKDHIKKNNLSNYINVLCLNILNYKVDEKDKFDYIIFTESLPLINKNLLKEVLIYMNENLLKDNGKLIFINNLVDNDHPKLITFIKPYLKYFILIDFGRIIKKSEIEEIGTYINKKFEINQISKNKIYELALFNFINWKKYNFIYKLINKYIINLDYDIKQYEIILG
jgi:2-polyprenyl-3-methyl-5-hydroxy-6-metoxy-1,4-benzoquinol methylase